MKKRNFPDHGAHTSSVCECGFNRARWIKRFGTTHRVCGVVKCPKFDMIITAQPSK
jgi:hypothetical protein